MELHEVTADYANFTPDEYRSMLFSLQTYGIKVPIKIWRGKIVDGRHRYTIGLAAGIPEGAMPFHDLGDISEDEMRHWVAVWNERRRSNTQSMTNEQKRHRVANVLEAHPDWTDGRIAEEVGISSTSVGKWRSELQPTVQSGEDAPKWPQPRKMFRVDKRGHKHPVVPKATKMTAGKSKAKRATRVATPPEKSLSVDLWASAGDAEANRFLRDLAKVYPEVAKFIFDHLAYESKLALIEHINAWCAAEDEKAEANSGASASG